MVSEIKTVSIEFIRKGPPHNQLLSPLTEYIAISGTSGAGSISIPFEHAYFDQLIARLRYPENEEEDQSARLHAIRKLGEDLGGVLNQVPGLPGVFTDIDNQNLLINLQFISAASELALLPFEMAKLPAATGRSSDEFLTFLTSARICITRKLRWISNRDRVWTDRGVPKILFIVGLEIDPTLVVQHRNILHEALRPWGGEVIEYSPDIKNAAGPPTVHGIYNGLMQDCSFVHILAHGAETPIAETSQTGLLIQGETYCTEQEDSYDVFTGDRFACLLHSLPTEINRPDCIMLASCDSARVSDIAVPGGPFSAHLHEANIPLVIASQFPLTVDSSLILAKDFYPDVLWGAQPLEVIARLRAKLHASFPDTHDWASIVVYDGLPENLADQLNSIRYHRAKVALYRALEVQNRALSPSKLNGNGESEGPTNEEVEYALNIDADTALKRLPGSPAYESERLGLLANHAKYRSEWAYYIGEFDLARSQLTDALEYYRQGAVSFLAAESSQLHSTLHWFNTQVVSIRCITNGHFNPEENETEWQVAKFSATVELNTSTTPFWAHSNLAELWFLRLLAESPADEAGMAGKAKHHAQALRSVAGRGHEATVNTAKQFKRYATHWLSKDFAKDLDVDRSSSWDRAQEIALELVDELAK